MLVRHLKRSLLVVTLACIAPYAFAEDAAPVYDADSMPSQFDGQPDSGPVITNSSGGGAVTSPAPAQVLQTDNAYVSPQSLTLDQRIGRVEQQLNNADRSNSAAKTEQLQKEVQTLRGQVEELTHQVQTLQTQSTQMQAQQRTMAADLDKRLAKAVKNSKTPSESTDEASSTDEMVKTAVSKSVKSAKTDATTADASKSDVSPAAATAESKSSEAAQQPNEAEEQQIYQTAYNLVKSKKYNDAITALQKMLKKYPSGQFAANAHFSLGGLYTLMGKNSTATDEYMTVMTDFPDSPKVPEAQLKLGMVYLADGKWADARSTFKRVQRKFPGTASAHQATEQLKQLKQAGH